MAKINKWDKAHLAHLSAIQKEIDAIYSSAAREAAAIGVKVDKIRPDKIFSFADYPTTKAGLDKMLNNLRNHLQVAIISSIRSAWTMANNKNNELCNHVFGDNAGKIPKRAYDKYYSTNAKARKAFEQRVTNGMNLSDRVWKYTNEFKGEIEMGLDVGIRSGLSAAEMTKELNNYLQHPDMLFRRVRDEHGNLKLSQKAKEFHPGQGVYRSSYKNARRLAATETNMAYRTADQERWQQLDFVVGIRVVISNNHTLLGRDGKPHEFTDICDELSAPANFKQSDKRGLYPKDFKFVGWHPHCRCHAISVLKTAEELAEDNRRIMAGKDTVCESVNKVTETAAGI